MTITPMRADGGGTRWVYIGDSLPGQTIATWTGGFLSDTGVWTNNSDAARKTDFESVEARDILTRVTSMPIKTWRYDIDDPATRHIGPMAQDFRAAFGLGTDDKHIGTVDADGVALRRFKVALGCAGAAPRCRNQGCTDCRASR